MTAVNLSWSVDGSVSSYNIYRSTSPMNIANLPTPLQTGITQQSYTDSSVVIGNIYYYRIGSVSNGVEKVSAEIKCRADSDIYFSQVTSLLHLNGVDRSTSYPDIKSVAWANNGNAKISINDFKFNGSSLMLDGTNSYLSAPASIMTFGTGDFTIECWIKLLAYPTAWDGSLIGYGVSTTSGFSTVIGKNNGAIGIWDGTSYFGGTQMLSLNSWVHLAFCRLGNELSVFINGTKTVLTSNYTKQISANSQVRLGGNYAANNQNFLNGYINDLRITAGAARYTENFTPPVLPFLDS